MRLIRFSVAVLGRTFSDPAMARVPAPGDVGLITFTAGLIAAARTGPGGDDRVDADICWSPATSLAVDVAIGHRTPEAARAVLDYQVDRVLRPARGPWSLVQVWCLSVFEAAGPQQGEHGLKLLEGCQVLDGHRGRRATGPPHRLCTNPPRGSPVSTA
ncbi:hypothetical protein [Saccharothrix australiensis]|uniref:hypothetical protein n=1 Tax=Saccharothrix australiensis TaxID=2072 RepID=UPI001B872530|nr:hypothetical protein [Saccharothrix australiensis]